MNAAYNAAIALYRAAAHVASTWSPKVRRMIDGQHETLGRLAHFRESMAPGGFDVWFHAASLGEFEQARPLIDALLAQSPDTTILLSFFSPSGYEVRHNYNSRVAVVYMPFDTPKAVRAFLDAAAPRMAVFVKYEFWGNYLEELKRRNISTYIVSAIFRPSQVFFKPWGGMFRSILRKFDHLYVQDDRSRELLAGIGISAVTVAGDTRFDRVTEIRNNGRNIAEVECFKTAHPSAFTLVVGSSWERDEDIYIDELHRHHESLAIIAPHEFDSARLTALRQRLGAERTMLFSEFSALYAQSPEEAAKTASTINYLIIDCFGLLSSLYRYADVAHIGGGFGAGIHNINEAAVYGIPVTFGPRHQKFNEARDLIECGGGFCISNSNEFTKVFTNLTTDINARTAAGNAAGNYIATHIGASTIIMNELFNITLNPTPLHD